MKVQPYAVLPIIYASVGAWLHAAFFKLSQPTSTPTYFQLQLKVIVHWWLTTNTHYQEHAQILTQHNLTNILQPPPLNLLFKSSTMLSLTFSIHFLHYLLYVPLSSTHHLPLFLWPHPSFSKSSLQITTITLLLQTPCSTISLINPIPNKVEPKTLFSDFYGASFLAVRFILFSIFMYSLSIILRILLFFKPIYECGQKLWKVCLVLFGSKY